MARILVVDDDEQIRAIVKRLVILHGHTVDTANDGVQALDLLQVKSYDLMIIDNMMPNMSGTDVVAMLRTSDKFKDMKILMFTGVSYTNIVDKAYEAGINDFIVKPFAADRLMAKISASLPASR